MLQNFFLRRLQYNRQTRRFFVTIVALGFTIDGVYAVLFNLYLLRLGYDTTFIGQVNSIGLLTFAVMSLPAGLLGAYWTSTHMLRVGIGFLLVGTSLLPLAELSPIGWQPIWLIVTYALILAGFSLYFVNGAPFLMAVTRREEQNRAFAMQTALLSLAAFVGSLIGGNLPELISYFQDFTLDDPEPYRYTLMVVTVVMFIAFWVTWTIDEHEESAKNIQASAMDPVPSPIANSQGASSSAIMLIGIMSLIRFLQVAGIGTVSVYFNVYMDTQLAVSPGTIGTIAAIGRLISVPTVLFAPMLIRRRGIGAVAVWASLATAACFVPLALIPYWWVAALGFIGSTALASLRFTAFIVYIMMLVPRQQQSIMAGAGEMAAGGSFALMALSGGYILASFSFRDLFLLGAGLSSLGTVIFWFHLRTHQLLKPRTQISDTLA
jgi:MFS family permease